MQSSVTLYNIFHSYKLTYVKSLFSVFMLKYSIHSDSYYYKFNTNRWNLNELVYVHISTSFRYLRGMWDSCQPNTLQCRERMFVVHVHLRSFLFNVMFWILHGLAWFFQFYIKHLHILAIKSILIHMFLWSKYVIEEEKMDIS